MNKWFRYLIVLLTFVLGGCLGWYSRVQYVRSLPTASRQVRQYTKSKPGNLINPLLYSEDLEPSSDFRGLKNELTNYVGQSVRSGAADSISVYYRDLNTARWTGVNENDGYKPSSMLKVMVMMIYYAQADNDPSVLQQKLFYRSKPDSGQYYKPEHVLSTDYYTVQELIDAMITYSDNDAAAALTDNNKKDYVDLFSILRLPYPKDDTTIDFMSPQSYSILFRTLYGGTYVSHQLSEKALGLLTKTTFNKGLVAGVPPEVIVAHKFGEHTQENSDLSVASRELHDCGIVYDADHPYLLCVMTKGKDFSKLESVIAEISRKAYSFDNQ